MAAVEVDVSDIKRYEEAIVSDGGEMDSGGAGGGVGEDGDSSAGGKWKIGVEETTKELPGSVMAGPRKSTHRELPALSSITSPPTKPFVLGVTGCTRSGKSTLTRALAKQLGQKLKVKVVSIHQDRYFRMDLIRDLEGNWDHPGAIDHDAFAEDIESILDSADSKAVDIVIIEGFMAFHEDRVARICHKRILVSVPEATCRARRKQSKFYSKEYFDECIWLNHESYLAAMQDRAVECDIIDGTAPKYVVLRRAITLVKRALNGAN